MQGKLCNIMYNFLKNTVYVVSRGSIDNSLFFKYSLRLLWFKQLIYKI